MIMETDIQPATELLPLNTIRVETALSRWPVHRLARKGTIDISIREGAKTGDQMTWEVDYSKKHGQPGPLAYKIDTLIINRRIEEARRPIPRLLKLGSLSDICRELNLADSGKNRKDIKNSLFQNAFAGITARTRYVAADGTEKTLEAAFTRYSVIFTGEKLPDGRKADGVYVVLNDVFIRVINGAMTRPLDYDYLKSLPPAPQRFYEVLSYQMYAALKYDRPRAKLVYSEFCAHAPQTRHTDWERVRSQMNKIHRPHRQSGYIAKVDFQQTTSSDNQPDWIMFYQPGPTARAEFRAFNKRGGPNVLEMETLDPLADEAGAELTELEQELVQRGVSEATAQQLVCDHAEEKILQQVEILDWRLEGKRADKIDDPAAWLVSAIKSPSGHAAPKGFVSKAERQRRLEAKQAKDRQAAQERCREQEKDASERAQRKQLESYLKQLDQAERTALEAKVLAAASPTDRESYNSHIMAKFRDTLMISMIREYLGGKPELEQIAVEA
jgi:hypothetical protein